MLGWCCRPSTTLARNQPNIGSMPLIFIGKPQHNVASELKYPIWHSSEWQIGSFSSEATIIKPLAGFKSVLSTYIVSCIPLIPANMRLWPNGGSMVGQRRRRWPSIEPPLREYHVYAGIIFAWSLGCRHACVSQFGISTLDHELIAILPTSILFTIQRYHF